MGIQFDAKYFNSADDLENYVGSKDYESSSMPGICAGIDISGTGDGYWVKLRYDDNNYREGEGALDSPKQQIPTTRYPIVNNLIRYLNSE